MCMITLVPAGVAVPWDGIVNGGITNSDGHGWALAKGSDLLIGKSMNLDEALETLEAGLAQIGEGATLLFHSRWGTHGSMNEFNVHPFWIGGENSGTVMAHNGVLPSRWHPERGKDMRSDTRKFADNIGGMVQNPTGVPSRRGARTLAEHIGSGNKLAFLSVRSGEPRVRLVNSKAGVFVGGVWYSNHGWEKASPRGWSAGSIGDLPKPGGRVALALAAAEAAEEEARKARRDRWQGTGYVVGSRGEAKPHVSRSEDEWREYLAEQKEMSAARRERYQRTGDWTMIDPTKNAEGMWVWDDTEALRKESEEHERRKAARDADRIARFGGSELPVVGTTGTLWNEPAGRAPGWRASTRTSPSSTPRFSGLETVPCAFCKGVVSTTGYCTTCKACQDCLECLDDCQCYVPHGWTEQQYNDMWEEIESDNPTGEIPPITDPGRLIEG